MSDAVILGICSLIASCFTAYLSFLSNKKATSIHALVNSSYGTSLRVGYIALKKVSDETKVEEDIKATAEAKRLMDEHTVNQEADNKLKK